MTATLVEFPKTTLTDVPAGLRAMADAIENGEYGEVALCAWVLSGDAELSVGLLGHSPSPAAEAHLLYALAQQTMLETVMD